MGRLALGKHGPRSPQRPFPLPPCPSHSPAEVSSCRPRTDLTPNWTVRPHLTLPVIDAQDIVLQSGLQVRYRPAAAAGIDQSLVTASSSLLCLSRVCLARFLLTRVDDAFGHFGLVPCTSAVTSTNCVVVSPGNQALLASHETFVPGPPN